MMLSLEVARVVSDELVSVGSINRTERGAYESFVYHESYLERADACPLSLSLPLSSREYLAPEIRPYFEGLLPEGPTREALVGQLGLPRDDYLVILEAIGLDCIGISVRRMRRVCSDLAEQLPNTLLEAGGKGATVIETLPYSAEDISSDAESRLDVVLSFVRGA